MAYLTSKSSLPVTGFALTNGASVWFVHIVLHRQKMAVKILKMHLYIEGFKCLNSKSLPFINKSNFIVFIHGYTQFTHE